MVGSGLHRVDQHRARAALFPGHQQPTLPADLGFYDLRVPETRQAQSELARATASRRSSTGTTGSAGATASSIARSARCSTSGEPDVGFALAWANQTWTGTWHAAPDRVLKQQTYPGPEDDRRHFETSCRRSAMSATSACTGRPVFYVFRPEELPDAAAFVDRWQGMAREAGLDGLYLVAEVSDLLGRARDYARAVRTASTRASTCGCRSRSTASTTLRMRPRRKLLGGPEVWPYSDTIVDSYPVDPHIQPCVYPNWDNTPRAVGGASPSPARRPSGSSATSSRGRAARRSSAEERLLWVKSWNEWAEGNHLEPDLRHGHGWLRGAASRAVAT